MTGDQRKAVTLVGAGLLLVSCAGKPMTPVPKFPPGNELRLESITPEEGAALGAGAVLHARLAYTIADFGPGTYRVITQFETFDPEVTAGDDTGACTLATPSGRCELRFPMDVVWSSRAIKRPFSVWFYLTRRTGTSSMVVARAGPVRFRAK